MYSCSEDKKKEFQKNTTLDGEKGTWLEDENVVVDNCNLDADSGSEFLILKDIKLGADINSEVEPNSVPIVLHTSLC